MKAYLAADFARRPEIRQYAADLMFRGHQVVSEWLFADHQMEDGNKAMRESCCGHLARSDVQNMIDCDTVILFTTGEHARGGRHVEWGMGVALKKNLIIVGPKENIFHTIMGYDIKKFYNWEEFLNFIDDHLLPEDGLEAEEEEDAEGSIGFTVPEERTQA